jgi:D-aminopeptidase
MAAPITEAEIKPIAGTWLNAQEPSLFELAWRNGEPVVTQNGMPFALGRRADGWFAAERGSFEFALKPGRAGPLRVDLGAGRVVTFTKLGRRKPVPAAIAGTYASADSGATWHVRRGGADHTVGVSGPLVAGGPVWTLAGIDADTVEVISPAGWITATQLARLERDRTGKVVALLVSTGRIKKMRFARVS